MALNRKLNQLIIELKKRDHPYFLRDQSQPITLHLKKTGENISISSDNEFLVIPTTESFNRPYLVVNVDNYETLTASTIKGIVCQSHDVLDISNLLFNDKIYLHHIYKDQQFPFIFLKMGMLFSPELYNKIRENPKTTIYEYCLSKLKHDIHKYDNGLVSSRANDFIVKASFFRENPNYNHKNQDRVLEISELELAFERVRKERHVWAPSRISGFYLVSDEMNDRENLRNMFYTPPRESIVVELRSFALMFMIKVDYRWVELYREDPNPLFIENYWNSIPVSANCSNWEYLYEGALEPSNAEQIQYFKDKI
jgi:hypothetical protein